MHEAVVMYAFYLAGIYLSRWKGLEVKKSWIFTLSLAVLSFFVIYFTYDLNRGPFIPNRDAVIIVASIHGNMLLFPITAIVGCLFILLLANMAPVNKYILIIGQNSMIVFPMNGIFYTFINGRIAQWAYSNLSHHPLVIFATCSVVTIASLILCIPCVYLLNGTIPQLVGKPRASGPLFKSFLSTA